MGPGAREHALRARGKKRGAAAVREGESRREGTRRRAGRMERKRKRGHCLNVSARSHARRACAEYPGPSWTPRLPPRVIGSLALPLLSLSTGSNPSCSLAPSSRGHVPPSPTLSLPLHRSLLPSVILRLSLPSDIRIDSSADVCRSFSPPRSFSIRFSSANNIRFHHLSRRGDRAPTFTFSFHFFRLSISCSNYLRPVCQRTSPIRSDIGLD